MSLYVKPTGVELDVNDDNPGAIAEAKRLGWELKKEKAPAKKAEKAPAKKAE